jgi:microcystin-dependent protein
MPFTNTTKYLLRKLTGASLVSDIDAGFEALADDIDGKMVGISEGPIGSRPTSTGGSPGILGRLYRATDEGGKLYFDFGTGWTEMGFASSAHEPGDLKPTARSAVPAGWLLCDGALVLQATYGALFTAIGHTYNGNVDPGGGQFRLPDYRGRALVGVDGAAGRLSANDALGQSGGAEKHTLLSAESGMPGHGHGHTLGTDSRVVVPAGGYVLPAAGNWFISADGTVNAVPGNGIRFAYTTGVFFGGTQGDHAHAVTGGVSNAAGQSAAEAHNNMPPYQTCNVLIKT